MTPFNGVELPFCGDLADLLQTEGPAMTARWSPEDEDDWTPRTYDNGGTIAPVITVAFSGLAGPEPVLTPELSARLAEHLKSDDGRPEFDEGDQ